jgi:hypothetical protein
MRQLEVSQKILDKDVGNSTQKCFGGRRNVESLPQLILSVRSGRVYPFVVLKIVSKLLSTRSQTSRRLEDESWVVLPNIAYYASLTLLTLLHQSGLYWSFVLIFCLHDKACEVLIHTPALNMNFFLCKNSCWVHDSLTDTSTGGLFENEDGESIRTCFGRRNTEVLP